jgi:hypothetical protein
MNPVTQALIDSFGANFDGQFHLIYDEMDTRVVANVTRLELRPNPSNNGQEFYVEFRDAVNLLEEGLISNPVPHLVFYTCPDIEQLQAGEESAGCVQISHVPAEQILLLVRPGSPAFVIFDQPFEVPLPEKKDIKEIKVNEGSWRRKLDFKCVQCNGDAYLHPYTNSIWGCKKCGFTATHPAPLFKSA